METGEYPAMRLAVEKLTLNDSSVTVHRDSSVALGQGWRLGFLGLLHMDVFRQRLEEVHVYIVCKLKHSGFVQILLSNWL
jgi:translation elongation factor EF-4